VLRVDVSRWDQTAAELHNLALHAPHPRSRERFLVLHEIAQGGCATEIATRSGRHPQTVMGWVHAYNDHGPAALFYRRSGGRPPFARGSRRLSAK
jgi:transposase